MRFAAFLINAIVRGNQVGVFHQPGRVTGLANCAQQTSHLHQGFPRNQRDILHFELRAPHWIEHPLGELYTPVPQLILERAVAGYLSVPLPSTMHNNAPPTPCVPRVVDRQGLVFVGSLSTCSITRIAHTNRWTTIRSFQPTTIHRTGTGWSWMSDLAACYAATVARPDGLAPRDRLIADFGPSHRSVNSAGTNDHSLVIYESELANSRQDVLGAIYG
tara:strand:+ start:2791 stop:3444 length:654 start_codon:yes stop_codon:yes gene_type:complete